MLFYTPLRGRCDCPLQESIFLYWNMKNPLGTEIGNEGFVLIQGQREPLFRPVAVQKDGNFAAVGFNARNGQIWRTDHEIDMNHGIIQSGLRRFFLRHFRSAGQAGRIGRAEC